MSILEDLVNWVRKEQCDCRKVRIVANNFRCYKKDLFSVRNFQICQAQGFYLKGKINPASQGDKNLVDAHFPISKINLIRYVEDKYMDFIVPDDDIEKVDF